MVLTINLESGMPAARDAGIRLAAGLRSARAQHIPAVKLIHGYGSTGRGGAIKAEVGRQLNAMKRDGRIRGFVRGEAFSPFEKDARRLLELCPELARDPDYSRCNHGVTVVVL